MTPDNNPLQPAPASTPEPTSIDNIEDLSASITADLSNLTDADLAEAISPTPADVATAAMTPTEPVAPDLPDQPMSIPTTDTIPPAPIDTSAPFGGAPTPLDVSVPLEMSNIPTTPAAPTTPPVDQVSNDTANISTNFIDTNYNAPAPEQTEDKPEEPLKPASPVPGSIGSAISVPMDNAQELNLPEEPVPMAPNPFTQASQPKKKPILTIILIVIVLLLGCGVAAYFFLFSNNTASGEQADNSKTDNSALSHKFAYLDCKKSLNATELAELLNPSSAEYIATAVFKDDSFDNISLALTATYSDILTANSATDVVKKYFANQLQKTGEIEKTRTDFEQESGILTSLILSEPGFVLDASTSHAFGFSLSAKVPTISTVEADYKAAGYTCAQS